MRKRLFGLALFFIFIGITLGGCASMNARMQEYCGHEKEKAEVVAQYSPPAVVQPAPYRPPAEVPVPPPKKDRN
jgi:hypothetical protein